MSVTHEQEFLKEFEAWVGSQVAINEMAMEASRKIMEEDRDGRAVDVYIRYESKLDAYKFIRGKFANCKVGKGFHELLDNLSGERNY